MDSSESVDDLLAQLDGSGSDREWKAITSLRDRLGREFPGHLLAKYRTTRSWKPRSSCVYHAVRYARESDQAVELGKLALRDKSKVVRYRACMLLAYSLRKDLLEDLRNFCNEIVEDSRDDLRAAIDAIENGNHNFFVDRDHSGQATLNIE